MRTWFVTGASRGLGAELVRQIAARGDRVVATARNASVVTEAFGALERVHATALDVTDPAAALRAVGEAVEVFGGIDIVVNNAGYGLSGAIEETSDAEARALFDTNFFGVLNVTRAVLPVLRRQRHGKIVNIGSVSGLRGAAGVGLYSASKHALEGLTESLRKEVGALGIGVMIAELGAVRTGFLTDGAMAFAQNRISDYEAGAVKATTDFARHGHGTQLGDVVKSAQLICDVADAPDLPLHLPVGPDAVGAIESRAEPFEEPLRLWRDRAMATGHAEGGSGAARV